MRYKILYLIFVFNLIQTYSQQFYTNNGITEFDGSKAAFEPIRATNKSCVSIFDLKNGKIAAVININEFKFRLGLMQEHFNENYLESNKYPKSTFEGTIENYENIELIDSFEEVSINGVLTIKGVSNSILAKGYIKKIGDKIELKSSFSVILSDYNVKIPRIVFKKIDEEVKIKLNYSYAKKE